VEELSSRPIVLASLGTVFNKTPGVLEAIIEGVAGQDVNLVVAIGRDVGAARFGPLPANVRLEAYVPQPLLLPACAVFVTHGGFNSVKEALRAGVPMVVVPITADQPYSAERCAALGVGRVIPPSARHAASIGAAVEDVLRDPRYRAKANELRTQMASLPGPEHVIEPLERLAGGTAAVAGAARAEGTR
jgi:MGT family glycosyltransferase